MRPRNISGGLLLLLVLAGSRAGAAAPDDEHWTVPRGDFESRRQEFLELSARAQPSGLHSQIARLALGRGPLDVEAIRAGVATVRDRKDGADFAANALLRIYNDGARSPLLSAALRQEIKAALLGFRYWMDEPSGKEMLWMWSENHQINYHAAQFLAGQLFPDDTFTNNGQNGRWHRQKARERLLRFIDVKARTGFSEWDSNNCYVSIIAALANLAELADDPEIARRAAMLADLMFFDMAIDSFQGSYAGPHGRTYSIASLAAGTGEPTTGMQRLVWGMGGLGSPNSSAVNFLAAGKRYRVARTIAAVAGQRPEVLVNRERQSLHLGEAARFGLKFDDPFDWFLLNQCGKNSTIDYIERSTRLLDGMKSPLYDLVGRQYAQAVLGTYRLLATQGRPLPDLDRTSLQRVDKITYRTPDYQLAAALDWRKGSPGSQQHIWQATLGPRTLVFTVHPGPSPRYWLGRLPRVAQHRNVLIAVHDVPDKPHPGPGTVPPAGGGDLVPSPAPSQETLDPRTLAVFRRAAFDEVAQEGAWTFGRKGRAYVALWSRAPVVWSKDGVFGGDGLIAAGRKNVWVVQMGREKVDGTFATWRRRIAAAPIGGGELDVKYQAPGVGEVRFGWEGPLQVNGKEVPLGDHPRFDSPHARTPYGRARYEITAPGHRLVIDFEKGEHREKTPR